MWPFWGDLENERQLGVPQIVRNLRECPRVLARGGIRVAKLPRGIDTPRVMLSGWWMLGRAGDHRARGYDHGGEEGERKPAVAAFDGEQLTGGVAEPMKCDGGGTRRPVRA
jgi:hypothetical protein